MSNNDKKTEIRQRFIIQYRAALAAGLTKEQLANYLHIKPASIVRRRLFIKESFGLDLPYLPPGESVITGEHLKRFKSELHKLTVERNKLDTEEKGVDRFNRDYTKFDRFVITSAQNATPVHPGFFAALLNYCAINQAQLIIIPYRYQNPTSIFAKADKNAEYWDPKIAPYILDQEIKIAPKLRIAGHIKTQPTANNPLTGSEGYYGLDAVIFGHPKIVLQTVATPSQELPKILCTTGAVTVANYTNTPTGFRGLHHHSFAALVAEVDRERNGEFHIRHIHGAQDTGAFYDLDLYYTGSTATKYGRIEALVTGDSHAIFIDPEVESATYIAEDSIVSVLAPKKLVLHDVLDGYAISHHHRGNDVVRYGKHLFGRDNAEKELQITADFIDRISREGMMTYVVKSNHDEHLDRWLNENDPKFDLENSRFYHYMKYHEKCSISPTRTGFSKFDPFEFWCNSPDQQRGLTKKHLVKLLKRKESLSIANIEASFHGDEGTNGSRGSIRNLSKVGPKLIIGHSHAPGIYNGVYQVGVSSFLDLEYKRGCDAWLPTHCIIYPDGKRTLINVINGRWRLQRKTNASNRTRTRQAV
jgi:hypothetical protein